MQESLNPDVDVEIEEEEFVTDELTVLKARADKLGLTYHPAIGLEKLRTKIKDFLADDVEATAEKESTAPAVEGKETANQLRVRKRKEAHALIRIRVACMNPSKKEYDGEIITTGNSAVGTIKKYVAFNAEEGYHVPRMIYEQLLQRQCQIFYTHKDAKGNKSRKGKLIKEFSIEVLPPLTASELKDLAQRQAMAQSGD
jgi:hypothetical protein